VATVRAPLPESHDNMVVVAIGEKTHNRLRIAGEEIEI
jgi:hypothetical protein